MSVVLVAEDDTALRRVYRMWLRRMGHEADVVGSGLDGLKYATTRGAPDLVISDLHMLGSEGEELVAALASLAPALPVIVITGCDDRHRLHAVSCQPNVRLVLSKPVEHTQFVAAVDEGLAPPEDTSAVG